MPKKHLTDKSVRALQTDKRQEDFWDTRLEGFGCRVYESGRRSFFVRYRAGGKQRRTFIGRYDRISLADARDQARSLLGRVALGADPVGERRKAESDSLKFDDLAELYLQRHARQKKRPKSIAEDERQIDKDLRPAWGGRAVTGIDRSDVIALLDQIVDRGAPVMANRTRALVNKVFNFGIEEGLIGSNPAHLVKRRSIETARDRFLSEAEIRLLWSGIPKHTSPAVGAILRVSLLTAQRIGNVKAIRTTEIDGDLWTIPTTSFKSRRPHVVPLSPHALRVIGECKPRDGWLFPGRQGRHLESYRAGTNRLRTKLPFASDWTPHDLRTTATTHMGRMGIPRFVRERILGHSDTSVTAVYDHYEYLSEKREALARWGARLAEIVSAPTK